MPPSEALSVVASSIILTSDLDSILAYARMQHFSCLLAIASIYLLMKQKAPISVEAPTGAKLTSAEAERTLDTFIIELSVVELKRRFHDLPPLPDRL